jgi:hypothetical protein
LIGAEDVLVAELSVDVVDEEEAAEVSVVEEEFTLLIAPKFEAAYSATNDTTTTTTRTRRTPVCFNSNHSSLTRSSINTLCQIGD